MKKLYLDVETTGPNHWEHGVHQISGEIHVNGIKDFFDYHVRPFGEDKVNMDALAVSGKTLDDLKRGPLARDVWIKLYAQITSYVDPYDKGDKFFTYAYNAAFDEKMFRQWCLKLDFQFFGALFHSPIQCVMHKALAVLGPHRTGLVNVKLSTVAKHFGVEVDDERLHDSLYDVEITRKLDVKLDAKLKEGINHDT